MIQTHRLILWREADFTAQSSLELGFSTLKVLESYDELLMPKYLTAYGKRHAKEFNGDYSEYIQLVNSNINKEGGRSFPELGSTLSFFSSMDNRKSAGIKLTVGATNSKFYNSFILDFPVSYVMDGEICSQKIIELFRECVLSFQPFWGCILNNKNSQRFDELWLGDKPTTSHWLNFFNNVLVERIGTERIARTRASHFEVLESGVILQSKCKPLDDDLEEDLEIQRKLNNELGL